MDIIDRLPNLFVIGPTKTGTTSLYAYLQQHPDVRTSHAKELHFFDIEARFKQGLEFYLNLFPNDAAGRFVRVDATPNYFGRSEVVPRRINRLYANHCPLFVVTVRDPVRRAWSHYLHTRRLGLEKETFERALELERDRLTQDPEVWLGYVEEGLYAKHLATWLDYFPHDRFLFFRNEQLKEQPGVVLGTIFEALDLPTNRGINTTGIHNPASTSRSIGFMRLLVGPSRLKNSLKPLLPARFRRAVKQTAIRLNTVPLPDYPQLDPTVVERLRLRFTPDLQELEKMTGLNTRPWQAKSQALQQGD